VGLSRFGLNLSLSDLAEHPVLKKRRFVVRNSGISILRRAEFLVCPSSEMESLVRNYADVGYLRKLMNQD
jgi:hypothetical protein